MRFLSYAPTYLIGAFLLAFLLQYSSFISEMPTVLEAFRGIYILWSEGFLIHDLLVSLARWLIGWSLGIVVGAFIGYMTGGSRKFGLLLEGLMVILRTIPFVSLVPVTLLLFGISENGKFFLIGTSAALASWVVVHGAVRSISSDLVWRAQSLGCGGTRLLTSIIFPTTADALVTAARQALAIAQVVTVLAEMSGVYSSSSGLWWSDGIGYRMFRSLDESRPDLLVASILCFSLLGVLADITLLISANTLRSMAYRLRQRRARVEIDGVKEMMSTVEVEPHVLSVENMSARYGVHEVFSNIGIQLNATTLVVLGPSGCGKTTLVRSISGVDIEGLKTTGDVSIDGTPLSLLDHPLGIVTQGAPVFPHLTVWENVIIGHRARKSVANRAVALRLLSEFGLGSISDLVANSISGGQRHRLAFAMVLANQPSALLLDEPFGALDPILRRKMLGFFVEHVSKRLPTILVTHDLDTALWIGDTIQVGAQGVSHPSSLAPCSDRDPEFETSLEFSQEKSTLLERLKALT